MSRRLIVNLLAFLVVSLALIAYGSSTCSVTR